MRRCWKAGVGTWQSRVGWFGLLCVVLVLASTVATAAKKTKAAPKSGKSDTRPVTSTNDAASPTTRPAISAVPDPASIAEAELLIRSVFKEAYPIAATTAPTTSPSPAVASATTNSQPPSTAPATAPSDPRTLAQRRAGFALRFYRQGLMAEDDPAERYVLLREARDFAAAAGDTVTAMRAVGRMQDRFAVDAMDTRDAALTSLTTAAGVASSPGAIEDNCRAFLLLIEAASAIGDHDLAGRACIAAKAAADHGTNSPLKALLKSYVPEAGIKEEATAAYAAMDRMRADPNNANDNLTAGRFLCFARGNWDVGLPMLARGTDDALKELASADAKSPQPAARAEIWWGASDGQKGPLKRAMQLRAGYWYVRAWPDLTADARKDANIRLREMSVSHPCVGLLADLYEGENFERYAGLRVDSTIDFDWKLGPPDAHLGHEHFSICWQGTIHPPQPGKYEFGGSADDGAIIQIGKQTIADQWQKASGPFHTAIDLTGARETINIYYRQGGGHAGVHLLWKPPGEDKIVPVPASVLSHDPVWPWGAVAYPTSGRLTNASAGSAESAAGAPSVWYSKVAQQLPWHAAERYCQQHGGHLPRIRTSAQNNFLMQFVGGDPTWIGASDDEAEDWWIWTDGSHVDPAILYWGEGEPEGGRNENFAAIEKNKGWADWSGRHPFICQWDQ